MWTCAPRRCHRGGLSFRQRNQNDSNVANVANVSNTFGGHMKHIHFDGAFHGSQRWTEPADRDRRARPRWTEPADGKLMAADHDRHVAYAWIVHAEDRQRRVRARHKHELLDLSIASMCAAVCGDSRGRAHGTSVSMSRPILWFSVFINCAHSSRSSEFAWKRVCLSAACILKFICFE